MIGRHWLYIDEVDIIVLFHWKVDGAVVRGKIHHRNGSNVTFRIVNYNSTQAYPDSIVAYTSLGKPVEE